MTCVMTCVDWDRAELCSAAAASSVFLRHQSGYFCGFGGHQLLSLRTLAGVAGACGRHLLRLSILHGQGGSRAHHAAAHSHHILVHCLLAGRPGTYSRPIFCVCGFHGAVQHGSHVSGPHGLHLVPECGHGNLGEDSRPRWRSKQQACSTEIPLSLGVRCPFTMYCLLLPQNTNKAGHVPIY